MAIEVQADRVLIGHGGEFMPRFVTYLANSRVVKAADTLPSGTWDAIEVQSGGVLTCASGAVVKVTHLYILPGGDFDGSACAEIVIRDVPIDTAKDPFQWGNGIVNFGHRSIVGAAKTTKTELTADAPAGSMSIAVADATGWQVGDELLFADMADSQRRETPVVISSISGTTIGLSKRLDFEHASIRTPDGDLVLRPRVANLTRSIVIRSENPLATGTRGHGADVGEFATFDVRYVQHVGLGRTCADTLNSTTLDLSKIGTCQVGRYGGGHAHHADGDGSAYIGNVYQGAFGSKWAIALHQVHGARVEQNVCVDYLGGCYVTEDGPERFNRFVGNVAAFNVASRPRFALTDRNIIEGCPGCESAFWFHGVKNQIDGNEAWNNVGVGFNLINMIHAGLGSNVPSAPGAGLDTPYTEQVARRSVPLSFNGNISIGNTIVGAEYWALDRFPTDRLIAANNGIQVAVILAGDAYLRNAQLLCGNSSDTYGINSSAAYSNYVEMDGGTIAGCGVGVENGLGRTGARLANVTMQNRVNVNLDDTVPAGQVIFDRVLHKPLGSSPVRYIVLSRYSTPWQPGQEYPRADGQHWLRQQGSPHVILNWQGTGQNYQLLAPTQIRSSAAWRQYNSTLQSAPPICGDTQGETWDRCGMAFRGDTYAPAEVVSLDGLINAVARLGSSRPLGPARGILTSPNTLSPPVIEDTYRIGKNVPLTVLLTGQPGGEPIVTVDGIAPTPVDATDPEQRKYRTTQVQPGTHTVVIDRAGGERMTFTYTVAGGTEPTPLPPPPPQPPAPSGCAVGVSVTDVDGAVWTISADRPRAKLLRNGQPTRGEDLAAPYEYTLFDGTVYVNIQSPPAAEWWRWHRAAARWESASAPVCGGQ